MPLVRSTAKKKSDASWTLPNAELWIDDEENTAKTAKLIIIRSRNEIINRLVGCAEDYEETIPPKMRAKGIYFFHDQYPTMELPMPNDLAEAIQELNEAEADAKEDDLEVPSKMALDNAERLLKEMYAIAPQRFTVYPVSEGYIAIDARGQGISGRIAVVMCGSNGEVLCLVTVAGEHRRAHYSSARDLPDGFIREALASL